MSNRATDGHGDLLGWLVRTDESEASGVQLVDRQGRALTVNRNSDGTVYMTAPDGSRVDPRPITDEDPLRLALEPDGTVVVVTDGTGSDAF